MAQIEFCCTAPEEKALLETIVVADDVVLLPHILAKPESLPELSVEELPRWPRTVEIILWCRKAGPLRWIKSPPRDRGTSGDSFRAYVTATAQWTEFRPRKGMALIDTERSPLLVYSRARLRVKKQISPSMLRTVTSSPRSVSPHFEKWVTGRFGWVRRTARKVPELSMPGMPFGSVYAFPEAFREFRQGKSPFAVGLNL